MKRPSSRGMTLIGVLVAVGIMGILAAVMAALFDNMNQVALRGRSEADAQQMMHQIQQLIANRACDQVIRNNPRPPAASNPVVWDWKDNAGCAASAGAPAGHLFTTCADVDHLEIPKLKVAGQADYAATTLIYVPSGGNRGSILGSNNVEVKAIYLRQPDPAMGESQPSVSSMVKNNATYDTTTAKLVVRFQKLNTAVGAKFLGGNYLPEYTVDLTVATDQTTHQITYCTPSQTVQALNKICDPVCAAGCVYDYCYGYCMNAGTQTACGAGINPVIAAPVACPAVPANPVTQQPCFQFFYLKGFTSTGQPVCSCNLSCAYNNAPPLDYCQ